jgi:hypothetical protein
VIETALRRHRIRRGRSERPGAVEHIVGLKAARDQAQADAERAQAMLESSGQQTITPAMVRKFARTARERIRLDGGGYRRDHPRALAQRVAVANGEVRIMISKGDLLRTLAAASGLRPATPGVRSSVLVAEGVGFEPTSDLRRCRFSRPVPSTTRPPLQAL